MRKVFSGLITLGVIALALLLTSIFAPIPGTGFIANVDPLNLVAYNCHELVVEGEPIHHNVCVTTKDGFHQKQVTFAATASIRSAH